MKTLGLFSAAVFLASALNTAHAADNKERWVIKVDCCKSSGCYVVNRNKFHKRKSRAIVFDQQEQAQQYLEKLSLSLKEQNPEIVKK